MLSCKRIKQDAEIIEQMANSTNGNHNFKTKRQSLFAEIEKYIRTFIEVAKKARLMVTRETIHVRALMYRDSLMTNCEDFKRAVALRSFKASEKWINLFTKRSNLVSVTCDGEAGSGKLRLSLQNYDAENIYNMGETGLFYRLLPRRTYVLRQDRNRIRCTKEMKEKDLVTLIVSTNSTA